MNGDLSRVTFDSLNHYTRVVMQQGRVLLDADFNEQTAILLHYLQTLAADIIGPYGGPALAVGFAAVAPDDAAINNLLFLEPAELDAMSQGEKDALKQRLRGFRLLFKRGRYYVNGRLCEIERSTHFLQQKDQLFPAEPTLGDAGAHLVYLDVWERHITAVEDPNIHETALGTADTAARTKLVWQIKIGPDLLPEPPAGQQWNCQTVGEHWDEFVKGKTDEAGGIEPRHRGRLKAKAMEAEDADSSDPCITSPEARYRGTENQLYRVEIHKGGPAGEATFKWSRDNGTIVAAYRSKRGNDLIVTGMRDAVRWFAAGDWVELTHPALELQSAPGTMVQLLRVDGETLTIDPLTADGVLFDPVQFPNSKVRRWNQKETADDPDAPILDGGAVPITESNTETTGWIELEDGIHIQFQPSAAGPANIYRAGDYWLLPARTATGDVEWPGERGNPLALPPHGVDHYYAPLAIITIGADGKPAAGAPIDLRHLFTLDNHCV